MTKAVRPGSFCAPAGATGSSATGVQMVCSAKKPGDRNRWRRNADTPADNTNPIPARSSAQALASQPASTADRIRQAYQELAVTGPGGGWLMLSRLRDHLADIPRPELDRALTDLYTTDRAVSLEPEPNQKTLTPAARQAAIRLGGEDLHLLMIRPPQPPRPV
jgi:hypothetical protein